MSDTRAFDDQGLPWLEGVDDEDGPRGISARKMALALLFVLLAAAIVAGTFFWLGRRDPAVIGAPELIRADPAPYKSKPEDPGGLDVAGDSETAYSTSAGEDPDAALDLNRLPEGLSPPPEPVDPAEPPPPKKIPPKEVKEPAPPETPAGASGPAIQLGAYGSTIKADTAWRMLAGRFPEVAALNKVVVSATVEGKPIYRLRASGSSDATRAACAALRAGGESCLVVN
ncbi:SPOR domain-containing protein [Sphingomonas sp. LY29]|uniref:SPOR domain-containing protein n=1 Tax=Sphingomonas sp. LY29 TaxID=3095341 RepID=UPI002D78189C|nr:SPOR domain-containing protein [Sphingomonas sp. LY29]WRP25411.1 SPOR domain-containing protein [Sphingomonas sp. LY29]